MKYILASLILLTTLLAAPSQSHAQRQTMRFCEFDKPKFSVKLATTKTRYIRTKSARDLTEMMGQHGSIVGGLGGGEIGYKVESKFEVKQKDRQHCVGLKSMRVVFYGKPEVHIASNFKKGSCEYTAVLGHEQKHIRTMRKFLREYAPRLKKQVSQISKSMRVQTGPIPRRELDRAQEEIQNQMLTRLSSYLDSISPILAARQQKIDSEEEYERVFDMCKNWDKKFDADG